MAYCEKCKKHIGKNYIIQAEPVTIIRNGNVSQFDHMTAYCNICHSKIYVRDVIEKNDLTYNQIFGEVNING